MSGGEQDILLAAIGGLVFDGVVFLLLAWAIGDIRMRVMRLERAAAPGDTE